MLALSLLACSLTGTKSTADAPIDMGRFASQRWIVDPNNEADNGVGLLLLSTGEVSCSEFSTAGYDLEKAVRSGEGLIFMLEYESDDDQSPGWTGLWSGGYAYSDVKGERYLQSLAFSDTFLYYLGGYYSSDSSWVNIEDASDGLSGTFQNSYWSGKFDTEACGAWEEGEKLDTWYNDTNSWDTN